jgi:hypothetical protein
VVNPVQGIDRHVDIDAGLIVQRYLLIGEPDETATIDALTKNLVDLHPNVCISCSSYKKLIFQLGRILAG